MESDLNLSQEVVIPCNQCGSLDHKIIIRPKKGFKAPDSLSASGGVHGTQRIVRCKGCGLAFVSPRPLDGSIIQAYASAPDELYVSQIETRIETFRKSLSFLHRYATPPGRLLDIGTAAGSFLIVAKENGWDAVGVEPSRWLAQWGRENLGVKILEGTLAEQNFQDQSFDVVTMWDVLEHVPDPKGELSNVHRLLKPGGILIINFPNFGDVLARLAGSYWWFLLSVHLYYFTIPTLHRMLVSAGFRPLVDKPYFQTLESGHLIKMVGLYNEGLSKTLLSLAKALRAEKIKIPYYASQTLTVAAKEG